MVNDLKIARRMASKRFERVEDIFLELSISKGWIKYIRTLYAMTLSQLAKRLGVSVATISTAEKNELEGSLTLKRMGRIAKAMDCKFVYAFVPKDNLNKMIDERATKIAHEILRQANITMELEGQKVSTEEIKDQIDDLVEKIKYSKDLWETH